MIKNISTLFLIFFFLSCAGQVPPPGGDIDRIPPEVVEVYPKDGTLNYDRGFIEIKFSEYVDKRSVQDAIFISPVIEGKTEYDWSGKSVKLKFEEPLRDDRTYSITIGTDVKDLNNGNKMAQAFNFVFATGSQIDHLKIFGKVYAKKYDGILIGAYLEDEEQIDPTEEKPDYISQAGSDGNYKLVGLAEGTYTVFAIADKFRNLTYQKMEDEIGIPFTKVKLNESDSVYYGLDFKLTREDSIAPEILSATMTDRNHIQIEFNEGVDSTKISAENFFIYDSTSNNQIKVNNFYKGKEGNKKFLLSFDEFDAEAEDQLVLGVKNIFDRAGNFQDKSETSFIVSDKPDTTKPKLLRVNTNLSGNLADIDSPEFTFIFDDGIAMDSLDKAVTVFNSANEKLPIIINKIDGSSFRTTIDKKLAPNLNYKIELKLNSLTDAAGNFSDSIYVHKFKTITGLEFSGVSGNVNLLTDESVYVILESVKADKTYKQLVDENNEFNFMKIDPDKYRLWSFIDSDSSGEYSFGNVEPFEQSEKFKYYPDTLNLRARWPVGDIILNY